MHFVAREGMVHRERPGRQNCLPAHRNTVHLGAHVRHGRSPSMPWLDPVLSSVPIVPARRLCAPLSSVRHVESLSGRRDGRKIGRLLLCLFIILTGCIFFALVKIFRSKDKQTLVFGRENLQRIWNWEIESGHYPSHPKVLGFPSIPNNPALPQWKLNVPSEYPHGSTMTRTGGTGPRRVYLDIPKPNLAYPPRPVPGSVADLDMIMNHCDYDRHKYVRDCLEMLRVGAGLDNGRRIRRGDLEELKYIYSEDWGTENYTQPSQVHMDDNYVPVKAVGFTPNGQWVGDAGLQKKRGVAWEPPLVLPAPLTPRPHSNLSSPCDEDYPRIFHMFWTGPFTDKPYTALLSFLYTQNIGIHLHEKPPGVTACRPQFWFWVNPGPAAAVPNPSTIDQVYDELKSNPWSAPFLHPRFRDIIYFKLWNITEQLDSVPELKDEWRSSKVLFNSWGHKFNVSLPKDLETPLSVDAELSDEEGIFTRMGSKSADTVDTLSTIISDMARFILCHRFGGVYLDADNLLLRDWEELWGWRGAFAYRWSRLPEYNTAVLRLHKNSALGTFLLRTALKNEFDFHPMTITRYIDHAYLHDLLFRVPDALFDPAWLSMKVEYQRERPPQPVFNSFEEFFATPVKDSGAPQTLGFDGFFKGAYSYHWHNSYWMPFDRSRDWPDLGPRFIASEQAARAAASTSSTSYQSGEKTSDDQRDLDWATVIKRTLEAYVRGERPNMYGEWIQW